ncbi:MAG: DNA-protecting protein DprA [Acidobacteria bacterium]|nr:DNA-protecting protein DprA [Acidobacteriota bacterium]
MSPPLDLIALSLLPAWRWRLVAEQLRSGDPASDILHAHCADGRRGRARPPAWTDASRLLARAADALAAAAARGIQPLTRNDPEYPRQLAEIADPPTLLWAIGNPSVLSTPMVAIVGSRAGSSYALGVAERLASDLAARGLTVVSGLARGVDSSAHQGALSAGGVTVGVLGCGVDIIYPREHEPLARAMCERGAVISELVPGTVPKPPFFPLRNRIISGLARAVVVVEAGQKSGSLITARCALEQGRDVLAVPGNVLNGRNRGGHALLRDGARLVETAEDVCDEIGWGGGTIGRADMVEVGGAQADPVLAVLTPGESAEVGQISAETGLSVGDLLPRLMDLELRGLVRREPGGRFMRCGRPC